MQRFYLGLWAAYSILCSMASVAVPQASQTAVNRKLIASCMSKQMAAVKSLSYNEALKMCKDQLRSRNEPTTGSGQARPAIAH